MMRRWVRGARGLLWTVGAGKVPPKRSARRVWDEDLGFVEEFHVVCGTGWLRGSKRCLGAGQRLQGMLEGPRKLQNRGQSEILREKSPNAPAEGAALVIRRQSIADLCNPPLQPLPQG